jgi:hypothetical protein
MAPLPLSVLVLDTPGQEPSSDPASPIDQLTESGRFVIGDFIIARDGCVEERTCVDRPPRDSGWIGAASGAPQSLPIGPIGKLALAHTDSDLEERSGRLPSSPRPACVRASSTGADGPSAASRLTSAGPGGEPLDWSKLIVGKMLGRGASGYVRRASLGKQELAVKRIAIRDDERRRQTFHEITALVGCGADAGAANLVTCYGVRYIEGNIEIAMEFMDLGSLGDRLRTHGPLPEEALAAVLAQVCFGCTHPPLLPRPPLPPTASGHAICKNLGSLGYRLRTHGPLPEEALAAVLAQV